MFHTQFTVICSIAWNMLRRRFRFVCCDDATQTQLQRHRHQISWATTEKKNERETSCKRRGKVTLWQECACNGEWIRRLCAATKFWNAFIGSYVANVTMQKGRVTQLVAVRCQQRIPLRVWFTQVNRPSKKFKDAGEENKQRSQNARQNSEKENKKKLCRVRWHDVFEA